MKDGVAYPVVLDFDIIRDGTAETEMRSMVSALEIALPGGLHEKADIPRAVSGTTDHADTATKSMVLFGKEKQKLWGDTSSIPPLFTLLQCQPLNSLSRFLDSFYEGFFQG